MPSVKSALPTYITHYILHYFTVLSNAFSTGSADKKTVTQ